MNPLTKIGKNVTWLHKENYSYMATGTDRNGKRFVRKSQSWHIIDAINIWRGTKWLVCDGKRYKICSVNN